MLRTEEERELDRTFTCIETWEEFLTRWRAIGTEEEAAGLLYAGTKVAAHTHLHVSSTLPLAQQMVMLAEQARFYVRWASHANQVIAQTAQQLLVKYWMKVAAGWLGHDSFIFQQPLLEFLQRCWPGLSGPPYPRFVASYLLAVHKEWHQAPPADPSRTSQGRLRYELRQSTESVVRALLVWGLGYEFGHDLDLGREIRPHIERFLAENGYEAADALREVTYHLEPLSHCPDSREAKQTASVRAALALLQLQYWERRKR